LSGIVLAHIFMQTRYGSVSNEAVLRAIPHTAIRILDIGCGEGILGQYLKKRQRCELVGLEQNSLAASEARNHYDVVWELDIEHGAFDQIGCFDCIICSHVLEHLVDPHRVLEALAQHLSPGGVLVVALPNIAFWKTRWALMCGRAVPSDEGIFDKSHRWFFNLRKAKKLLTDAGMMVIQTTADGHFPLSYARRRFPYLARRIDTLACMLWPNMFGFQFVFVAQKP